MKKCIACGMPMQEPADFAAGDAKKDYCIHCAHPDGTMHSFEEKQESLAQFIISSQGLDPVVARQAALAMMKNLPAWKGYFKE